MIVSFYAGLLGLLLAKISLDTIRARRKFKISLGVGPNGEIESLVSAHSNFVAYIPILLFLTYLLETSGKIPAVGIHALCLLFTTGRVLHYMAFRSDKMNFRLRVAGMQLTLFPLITVSVIHIVLFVMKPN